MKTSSLNIKTNVIEKLASGNHLCNISTVIYTIKTRVPSKILNDENRKEIFMDILNRVSNAKILENTIRNFRSNNLTRVNDVKLRTNLAVLSVEK